MRTSLKVLGLAAAVVGLAIPPLSAAIVKSRIDVIDDPDAPEIALATIFDGEDIANRSAAFRGGTTTCWYGGQRLDLRQATLAEEGATLRVRCLFGGVQVLVPETWRVQVRSIPIFGGVQNASLGPGGGGPLLTIEAFCAFSGVSIDTQDEDAWDMGRTSPQPPESADAG
jgi:hypothetical protein